jgi:hypothetical protein
LRFSALFRHAPLGRISKLTNTAQQGVIRFARSRGNSNPQTPQRKADTCMHD